MVRFKAQIAENSLLFSRFVTYKWGIFALKKRFMTYSEVPEVSTRTRRKLMSGKNIFLVLSIAAMTFVLSQGWTFAAEEKMKPLNPVPKAYADKHMPEGWWTDPNVIKEGKKIFETTVLEYEFKRKRRTAKEGCATCHGIDLKKDRPKKRGSPDFRITKRVNRFSDSYWFWRVSEGIAKTRMPAWKEKLTEIEVWRVISYQHTWSHGNKPAVHDHKEIEHSPEE